MTGCSETGCSEKATHKFSAPSGLKVPLCDKHYEEWKKYEFKRSPLTFLVELGKWLIRLTGILLLIFGGLEVGLSVAALALGWKFTFNINLWLIFSEFHYYTESVLTGLAIEIAIFFVGLALFYVGFWKTEHDLW